LRKEAADQRELLEDLELVERAKGLLMKQSGLDEVAAYRQLRKLARDRNLKLAEVARTIPRPEDRVHP
jgi:response regulator NasT